MFQAPRTARSVSVLSMVFALLLFAASAGTVFAARSAKGSNGDKDAEPAVAPELFQGMEWRNVGPFRGGRVTAVAGVAQDPYTYYFGSTGGGVWKTEDAGTTWRNVSDGFFETGSVGALAVAPSDPNVVYAGMGEAPVRGVTTADGDGVYRSTDAGRTWTHLGLEATRHISAIAVHPENPDLVYVGAQGSPWNDSPERGVYRSSDGGATWELVLHVSDDAGVSALSMDPTNPRILYAAFWDHRRKPWVMRSGGPDSGVWKTTDGGDTWERLGAEKGPQEGGLPALMGKVGVAVSPAKPDRVWAMVEADDGGLFRSDDGGESWRRVNDERVLRARAWYYTHVFADPTDPDTVYVLNAPFMKSVDGGRTFSRVDSPHGDNHALWVNPRDHRYMINGNDGGANVSLNGGETWSTQGNQPTAQFYRVDVDRQFPYHLYGGQQDNTTVDIASAAPGGIGRRDWHQVGGCESAHLAFDPDDPVLIYAGCYQGMISEHDQRTGLERDVAAIPYMGLGVDPDQQPYRFNWNAPIEVSPQDPSVIYHGANVLLRSDDRGVTWTEISPDLTRDEPDKQGPGGEPITNESAGGEVYNTIFYIAPSPHDARTIWVGSDDGLVHLTRDGGASWSDVTPPGVGEAQINAIEVSPHQAGAAYVAVTRYKLGDDTPLAFKTGDYGAHWSRITDGFEDGDWVRVVREDPERRGLLYAGTEGGAYVSFDDGGSWQPLQLNLPVVPVTDLKVAGDDLVAATQGRAFWILDDLAPLRQLGGQAGDEAAGADLFLYQPAPAIRAGFGGRPGAGPEGQNPPSGVVIDYVLSEDLAAELSAKPAGDAGDEEMAEGSGGEDEMASAASEMAEGGDAAADAAEADSRGPELELEILDADGAVVRTFSSRPEPGEGHGGGEEESFFGGGGPKTLPVEAGMNRFVWDFRGEEATEVPGLVTFGGLGAAEMPPGTYTVRLSAGDREVTRTAEVVEDPRIDRSGLTRKADRDSYAEQMELLSKIHLLLDALDDGVLQARRVREQVEQEIARADDLEAAGANAEGAKAITEAGKMLVEDLKAWEETVIQAKTTNFQDIINYPNRLNAQIVYLFSSIDGSGPPVSAGARARFDELRSQWGERKAALDELLGARVTDFNDLVREHQVPAVVVPPTDDQREAADEEAGQDEGSAPEAMTPPDEAGEAGEGSEAGWAGDAWR